MVLVRHLVKICMKYNILIKSSHLSGESNILADSLSRQDLGKARRLAPWLDHEQIVIPSHLQLQILLEGFLT